MKICCGIIGFGKKITEILPYPLSEQKNIRVPSYPDTVLKIQNFIQYIYLVDIVTDIKMHYG